MEKKNRVMVKIGGRDILLSGNEPQRYINEVACYVDQKMNEIIQQNNTAGTTLAAILCAVNITDELFREKKGGVDFSGKISSLEDQILELEILLNESEKRIEELENKTEEQQNGGESEEIQTIEKL